MVALSLMVLLTVIAVALLGLAAVELRRSTASEARITALTNARLGLMMAIGQLQAELGDDRKVTSDASLLSGSKNPHAVGVWNGWSPNLTQRSHAGGVARVDYRGPKTQNGFNTWLVSDPDPEKTRSLAWHSAEPPSDASFARLFTEDSSGFDLGGVKIPVGTASRPGTLAWATTQENTKARINIGVDESRRISAEDRRQTPGRPNLANSALLRQPGGAANDWVRRSVVVTSMGQAFLDGGYGASRDQMARASRDFTTESFSLLTNPVGGGLKTDLITGFDMNDSDYRQDRWSDTWGTVANPFRSTLIREYRGQRPLYRPVENNAQARVFMNFPPASVNHKFNVNGAPTFDLLRNYYRTYRHLYSSGGATVAFERPYSHVAIPDRVPGLPYGDKTQSSITPVLNRVNLIFSVLVKADGSLCLLITPFVTLWNPYNVDIETEGVVVYPWIDFAIFWQWSVNTRSEGTKSWNSSLSRMVGEGFQGHGRSSRPYFYLHLTRDGREVGSGSRSVPPIRLRPGEVRVFCLADATRKDLVQQHGARDRTWRMRPVGNASDVTNSLRGGIVLDWNNNLDNNVFKTYRLKQGDVIQPGTVQFDRNTYFYIVNMADAWQIKNPNSELMVEARGAMGNLPALPATNNLVFYGQIHAGQAFGKGRDSFTFPSFPFEQVRERPQIVGSLLTYHRTALTGRNLSHSDLMFTTNPRQPYVTHYLAGGARFQTGPHYESLMQGGTSLSQLAMETTLDGTKAFYGPSHSANTGRSNLAFFEIPRSPTLSLGSFQHCDITATAFGAASQIANSWASPYLDATSISQRVTSVERGTVSPALGVYDHSYLANEALFDEFYLSGAAPRFGSRKSATGSPDVWNQDMIGEDQTNRQMITNFFQNPRSAPLRNPRMQPYFGNYSLNEILDRLDGPATPVRLASHLLYEGGFNVNSTSEEAWVAVLSSLRGSSPASSDRTAQSRFRHILTSAPASMAENDSWSGFRTLTDLEIKTLAKNIVEEIKSRGPFLSLGEFVNRRVSSDRGLNLVGALQSAIDRSNLNRNASYSNFDRSLYPVPTNLPNPNTGTNTPGWLTQADVLHALAPSITVRSDTFIVRSLGEAKSADGKVLATARLEAVVQRVPDFVDSADDPATLVANLTAEANKKFGRRFVVVSVRELGIAAGGTIQ